MSISRCFALGGPNYSILHPYINRTRTYTVPVQIPYPYMYFTRTYTVPVQYSTGGVVRMNSYSKGKNSG